MTDSPPDETSVSWRWGDPQFRYPAVGRARVIAYLERHLGRPVPASLPEPPSLPRVDPTRLSESDVRILQMLVTQGSVRIDDRSRITYSVGASYLDIVRLRQGRVPHLTDVVVEPGSIEEMEAVVRWADRERVAVVPRSGGTSVVGGLDPLPNGHRAVAVVSDRRFSQILEVDRKLRLASFGAGAFGPEIEAGLHRQGFTLGHFPQSFERSAAGGWIAARSFGQASTKYRTPADRLEGFTLVTPHSTVRWKRSGPRAEGPDPGVVVPGSEGTLGVIVDVTVRVEPVPERIRWFAALCPGWEAGVEFTRRLATQSPLPAVLRVSDGPETDLTLAESGWESGGRRQWLRRLAAAVLRFHSDGSRQSSLLIASYEGSREEVRHGAERFRSLRRELSAAWLPTRVGRAWDESRFRTPYLRDDLMERNWFVETFETFVAWPGVAKVKDAAELAVRQWAVTRGVRAHIGVHLSHPTADGTAVYFTVIAPQRPGEEEAAWEGFKQATAAAIVAAGGTVTHHHGIGRYHRPWAGQSLPAEWLEGLRTLKQRWDPNGIMNPGKTIPEG